MSVSELKAATSSSWQHQKSRSTSKIEFSIFVTAIILRSIYFTNFHIAGLQSNRVERWSDFFIPLLTVFIHLALLRYLPLIAYRILAVIDFAIQTGFATYHHYFSQNIDIHAILSAASEGVQVTRYILELVPKQFFFIALCLLILQLWAAPKSRLMLGRQLLVGMAAVVIPLFAFAVYKVPFYNAKCLTDYVLAIKLYGFYSAMTADLVFSGATPSTEELMEELRRRNKQIPLTRLDLELETSDYEDLLAIQVETLDFNLLGFRFRDREVTPFLNVLRDSSILLKLNAHHQGPSGSSGADFQFLTGLLPTSNYPAFKIRNIEYSKSLPAQLKKIGVPTYAFHGNAASMFGRGHAYKAMGVAKFYDPADYSPDDSRWGISDRTFFQESVRRLNGANGQNEFYFMITLSSHGPFNYVKHDAFSGDDLASRYFNSMNYVDAALKDFFPKLHGKYLVLVYGDHTAGLEESYYLSRENGVEYIPAFVFLVHNGRLLKPHHSTSGDLLSGVHDVRSIHHFALDQFPALHH